MATPVKPADSVVARHALTLPPGIPAFSAADLAFALQSRSALALRDKLELRIVAGTSLARDEVREDVAVVDHPLIVHVEKLPEVELASLRGSGLQIKEHPPCACLGKPGVDPIRQGLQHLAAASV